MNSKHRILVAAALLAVTGFLARATFGESDNEEQRARSIGFLIERLDDPSFTSRQSAGKQLADMGPAAFDALAAAAERGSREASTRAIEIVAGHLESDDAATRLAARRALHQIAAGENLTAMRQAETALSPPVPEVPAAQPNNRAFPQPLAAARGAFLPPFPMAPHRLQPFDFNGGHFRRVIRNNINGVKNIHVEENGRSVTIHEDPGDSITVEWTDQDGDNTLTKKFAANSIEQLKQQSPEAYELYERYTRDDAAPDRRQRAVAPPAPGRDDHFDRVEQHFNELIERFRQRAADSGAPTRHYDRMIENIERQKALHHEQRRHFEQLRAAIAPPW